MGFFPLDFRKVIIVLVLFAVPLTMFNIQEKKEGETWLLFAPFSFFNGLVQNAYSSFSSGVRGTTSLYLNLIAIKKNNRLMEDENSKLRAQLGALTELKLENERLNDLLGFKKKSKMELLAAKVIGKDIVTNHDTIRINRGSKHGLKPKMAAITTGGVVGYVIAIETLSSQILLLTDRYAAIDAIVQRSRSRGIISGQQDHCQMENLQRSDDVLVGDLIVTSGLHKIFPKGFPIGTVTEVEKSRYGISQKVTLSPAIQPQNLEEIFIVLNTHNEDFTPKEEGPESTPPPAQPIEPKKGE